jgi:hypothetical protein
VQDVVAGFPLLQGFCKKIGARRCLVTRLVRALAKALVQGLCKKIGARRSLGSAPPRCALVQRYVARGMFRFTYFTYCFTYFTYCFTYFTYVYRSSPSTHQRIYTALLTALLTLLTALLTLLMYTAALRPRIKEYIQAGHRPLSITGTLLLTHHLSLSLSRTLARSLCVQGLVSAVAYFSSVGNSNSPAQVHHPEIKLSHRSIYICMNICMYMYVCICMYTYTHTHTHTHLCVYVYM